MSIVLLLIGFSVIAFGIVAVRRDLFDDEGFTGGFIIVVGILISVIFAIILISILSDINDLAYYDDYIDILNEENEIIEEKLDIAVSAYMEHESETYSTYINSNLDSKIYIIAAIPDLSSQELIKSQINVFTQNKARITEYRLKQAKIGHYKWWAYFGK